MREFFSIDAESNFEKPKQHGRSNSLAKFSLAALLFLQGAAHERQPVLAAPNEPPKAESLFRYKNVKKFSEKEIENQLLTDMVETIFVKTEKADGYVKLSSESATHGSISFDELLEIIQHAGGATQLTVAHTHPAESYNLNYSAEQIEAIRNGYQTPGPMPPSLLDIQGSISIQKFLAQHDVKVVNKVFGFGYDWEFSVDLNNAFISSFEAHQKELEKSLQNTLSKKEINTIIDMVERGVDPRLIDEKLSNVTIEDSEYYFKHQLAVKLKNIEMRTDEKFPAAGKVRDELENFAIEMMKIDRDSSKVDIVIQDYLTLCARNGIVMNAIKK